MTDAVSIAALTHPGKVRARNEDAVLVGGWTATGSGAHLLTARFHRDEPLVIAVADGMGGHPAGDVASTTVVEFLGAAAGQMTDEQHVAAVLRDTDIALRARGVNQPDTAGMGSTVAGIVLTAESVVVFNVGDSRVFRVADGYLGLLSTDDRLPRVPGQPDDITTTALSQCLGGPATAPSAAPHVATLERVPDRAFLLCTDGLTDAVSTTDISATIAAHGPDAVPTLLELAIAAGAPDNVSVVLACV